MSDFPFQIKKTYNFDVHPSTVLGNQFRNVTVLGIIDRSTAELITNISIKHPLVYPYLPSGTSNDPEDYTYLKIRHESGEVTAIAYEWIQEETIELVAEGKAVVKFESFSPTDLSLLREVLLANGFKNFTVELVK